MARPVGELAPAAPTRLPEPIRVAVGATPDRDVKGNRLGERGVHPVELLPRGASGGQEAPGGRDDDRGEGEDVAQRDEWGGGGPLGLVLLGRRMPQPDL